MTKRSDLPRMVRPYLRPVTVLVFLLGLGMSLAAFALASRVAREQDQLLLAERAGVVSEVLVNSFNGIEASLGVLGPVGASHDGSASSLFAEAAGPLVTGTTTTVGVATADGTIFTVAAAVGEGPVAGDTLSGPRAVLAARAMALDKPRSVADLVSEAGQTTLLLARAVAQQSVAYQESVLNPGEPFSAPADSPFSDLHLALGGFHG